MVTADNVILVSAKDEGTYASLVVLHKLPIQFCLWVKPDRGYRKMVMTKLAGCMTEDRMIGCFTLIEKETLLKEVADNERKESRNKRKRDS